MEKVNTKKAAPAIGPYSQAIMFLGGKLVQTSGQIPADEKGNLLSGGIKEQTLRVLKNINEVLKAAGSGKDKIIKTTVFMKSLSDFGGMNEVYEEFMEGHKPARSTVEVNRLPKDVLIEIEALAEI